MKIKNISALIIALCIIISSLSVGAYAVSSQGYIGTVTGVNYYEQLDNDVQRRIYNALASLTPTSSTSLVIDFIDLTNTSSSVLLPLIEAAEDRLLSYQASSVPIPSAEKTAFTNNVVKGNVQNAIDAFQADHPEKFWIKFGKYDDGTNATTFKTSTYYDDDIASQAVAGGQTFSVYLVRITFTIKLSEDYDFIATAPAAYNETLQNAITNFPFTSSNEEYLILKSIHDGLISNVATGVTGTSNDAYGALVDGFASSYGYAKAFKLLCDFKNIPCILVYGSNISDYGTRAHMWNYVYIDETWYMVDSYLDDIDMVIFNKICYDYFLAGSTSIGTQYGNYLVNESHISDGDFSDSDYKNFIYPEIPLNRRDVDYARLLIALQLRPRFADEYYTTETITAFNEALIAGEAISPDLGRDEQQTIDLAALAIERAYANLVLIETVDMTLLDAALALTPAYADSYYTGVTINAFRAAREAALAAAPIQAEINAAAEALTAAFNALVLLDFTQLENALVLASGVNKLLYTAESYTVLENAVTASETNSFQSQEDIIQASVLIINAYRELIPLDSSPPKAYVKIYNYSGEYTQKIDWWKSYKTATMTLGFHTYLCTGAVRYVWTSSSGKVKINQDGVITNTGSFSRSSIITLTAYDADDNVIAKASVKVSFYKFNWQKSRLQSQAVVSDNVMQQGLSVEEIEADVADDSFIASFMYFMLDVYRKMLLIV